MPAIEKQRRKQREILTQGEPVAVVLETAQKQRAPGTIRLVQLSSEARISRALKFSLVAWVLAVPAVVAPPHFAWSIMLFLVGAIGGWLRSRQSQLILGGQANCPNCGTEQWLDGGSDALPFSHFCEKCNRRSLVHAAPAPDQSA